MTFDRHLELRKCLTRQSPVTHSWSQPGEDNMRYGSSKNRQYSGSLLRLHPPTPPPPPFTIMCNYWHKNEAVPYKDKRLRRVGGRGGCACVCHLGPLPSGIGALFSSSLGPNQNWSQTASEASEWDLWSSKANSMELNKASAAHLSQIQSLN